MENKFLTEKQAWKLMAKVFSKKPVMDEGHENLCIKYKGRNTWGLCDLVFRLYCDQAISSETSEFMHTRLRVLAPASNYDGYKWPLQKRGYQRRVAFCKRMVKHVDRETKS